MNVGFNLGTWNPWDI